MVLVKDLGKKWKDSNRRTFLLQRGEMASLSKVTDVANALTSQFETIEFAFDEEFSLTSSIVKVLTILCSCQWQSWMEPKVELHCGFHSCDQTKELNARNNARILISGSLSMFNNIFFGSCVQKAGSPTN